MEVLKGIGEPLRVYGFVGIYILHAILLIFGVILITGILYSLNLALEYIILIPVIILMIGIFFIKGKQKKYGHKGRFIIKAEKSSNLIIRRNKNKFFQTLTD